MLGLRVTIVRYTDRTSFPQWVEAEFVDAHGKRWRFEDKEPIFLDGEVTPPAEGVVRCTLVSGLWPGEPNTVVTITTLHPDHVQATDGQEVTFEVLPDQLMLLDA